MSILIFELKIYTSPEPTRISIRSPYDSPCIPPPFQGGDDPVMMTALPCDSDVLCYNFLQDRPQVDDLGTVV